MVVGSLGEPQQPDERRRLSFWSAAAELAASMERGNVTDFVVETTGGLCSRLQRRSSARPAGPAVGFPEKPATEPVRLSPVALGPGIGSKRVASGSKTGQCSLPLDRPR
jgi:hypothetical protein